MTGEWIGAYALSEASSGSDAMSLRTRAVLSPDGQHYILNGEKMWITNAGFADLYTVFAKVDGEKFTAFLIERDTPGFAVGAEEHKLGIRGSSTCPLILTDCKVPVGNLLGEFGKGHHIAFNILNIGRFKLGASAIGGAKNSLANAVRYAKERKAFGKTISEFGLVQQKIAESATGIFVGESMAYRTIGMIDAALASLEDASASDAREIQKKIEEYAVECSILKVWGSEMLDMVVDHSLQIFGGYGYVEEYPAERAYRDSRINRIFEGTNEINRLIITGWLMKRAASGQLPLLGAIKKLMAEVMEPPSFDGSDETDDPLAAEAALLANLKKVALFCSGSATQKYMQALQDQQEIMGDLADMTMQVFALESALLRARKLGSQRTKVAGANRAGHGEAIRGRCTFRRREGSAARSCRGCRRRHAAHPTRHPAAALETHAARHHCAEPIGGAAAARRRRLQAIELLFARAISAACPANALRRRPLRGMSPDAWLLAGEDSCAPQLTQPGAWRGTAALQASCRGAAPGRSRLPADPPHPDGRAHLQEYSSTRGAAGGLRRNLRKQASIAHRCMIARLPFVDDERAGDQIAEPLIAHVSQRC